MDVVITYIVFTLGVLCWVFLATSWKTITQVKIEQNDRDLLLHDEVNEVNNKVKNMRVSLKTIRSNIQRDFDSVRNGYKEIDKNK